MSVRIICEARQSNWIDHNWKMWSKQDWNVKLIIIVLWVILITEKVKLDYICYADEEIESNKRWIIELFHWN